MYKKLVALFCFCSQLHADANLKLDDAQIVKKIDTYRIRLDSLSQTIKGMSKIQKQFISPRLLEFDNLLQDVERVKRWKENDLANTELQKLEIKLKNRIRFISRYCKDCQAGKMLKSPGERNVFEERSSSKSQKLEDDQIQYVQTVETVKHMSSDSIVNEESGRP